MLRALKAKLIIGAVQLRGTTALDDEQPIESQKAVLKRLLEQAKDTEFGRYYDFKNLINRSENDVCAAYQKQVPTFNYEEITTQWWHRMVAGVPNVCWPEKISFIANSSGTTAASTKMIPVSPSMIRQTQATSKAFMAVLPRMGIDIEVLTRSVLSIGGTTRHKHINGMKIGLFSGIVFGHTPAWIRPVFKPEPSIYDLPEWQDKVDYIVQKAPQWDIGSIYGFPCWVTPLAERIATEYRLNSLQDIWPNLKVYTFAGMKIDPYRARLSQLLGEGLTWIESYVASEGYFAIQLDSKRPGMRLLTNWSIYYEFIPFDEKNFDENGQIRPDHSTLLLDQIELDKEYALLITNNSGAWRYLIGDTIKFCHIQPYDIQFVGRTAHFLNDTNERLSVGNLELAFASTCADLGVNLNDFSVRSEKIGDQFCHTWYVEGTELPEHFVIHLDRALQNGNDDYSKTRKYQLIALPQINLLPPGSFHKHLRAMNRDNGQSKIARVLKGDQAKAWLAWLALQPQAL